MYEMKLKNVLFWITYFGRVEYTVKGNTILIDSPETLKAGTDPLHEKGEEKTGKNLGLC